MERGWCGGQPSGFPLGVGYSERLNDYATQIATDSSGAIYLLRRRPAFFRHAWALSVASARISYFRPPVE
jgi:hypothetical protein